MKRSEQRELLIQMIYQMEIQNDFCEDAKTLFCERFISGDKQIGYIDSVYSAIIMYIDQIDGMIRQNCDNWKFDRIAKVDLSILRLAVCEIMYIEETPDSVAINEAVELAKKFGADESSKFVNGVLGKISRVKNEE